MVCKSHVYGNSNSSKKLVIQWSKKTGDYSVLSHPDLCVLALTFALHEEDQRENEKLNEREAPQPASRISTDDRLFTKFLRTIGSPRGGINLI